MINEWRQYQCRTRASGIQLHKPPAAPGTPACSPAALPKLNPGVMVHFTRCRALWAATGLGSSESGSARPRDGAPPARMDLASTLAGQPQPRRTRWMALLVVVVVVVIEYPHDYDHDNDNDNER